MTRRLGQVFGLLLSLALGCGSPEAEIAPSAEAKLPLDQVWLLGTHNSYWAERQGGDPYGSGVGQPIAEQILSEGARHLEFDLHTGSQPGTFSVHHVVASDSVCLTLQECLGLVRTAHAALPQHHPIVLMLEMKNLSASLFDDQHTIADLDRTVAEGLGPLLYRPKDLLARCPGQPTLLDCIRQVGWPTLGELRGRILVAVMGYWHMFGGQDDIDWVNYATSGDIADRAAFPLATASSWDALVAETRAVVSKERYAAALAQTVFLERGNLSEVAAARKTGRMIRYSVNSPIDFERAVAAGAHLLPTDVPWEMRPSRAHNLPIGLLGEQAETPAPPEPGTRLHLSAASKRGERVLAYIQTDDPISTWESTVTTGSDPYPELRGCLVAAERPDEGIGDSVEVCTAVLPNRLGPKAARTQVEVTVCSAHDCSARSFLSSDGFLTGPGAVLSMKIEVLSGASCVTVRSARYSRPDLSPVWALLGSRTCVSGALTYQGIARRGGSAKATHFFNTRRNDRLLADTDLVHARVGATPKPTGS